MLLWHGDFLSIISAIKFHSYECLIYLGIIIIIIIIIIINIIIIIIIIKF